MTAFENTFDNAAADYDQSRPTYVKEIYDAIFRYKPLDSHSHVLEIGLGTGKAALLYWPPNVILPESNPAGS